MYVDELYENMFVDTYLPSVQLYCQLQCNVCEKDLLYISSHIAADIPDKHHYMGLPTRFV